MYYIFSKVVYKNATLQTKTELNFPVFCRLAGVYSRLVPGFYQLKPFYGLPGIIPNGAQHGGSIKIHSYGVLNITFIDTSQCYYRYRLLRLGYTKSTTGNA